MPVKAKLSRPSLSAIGRLSRPLAWIWLRMFFRSTPPTRRKRLSSPKAIKRANMAKLFGELPPCLIGIEACSSSHYCARELAKLGHLPAMSKRFINLTR